MQRFPQHGELKLLSEKLTNTLTGGSLDAGSVAGRSDSADPCGLAPDRAPGALDAALPEEKRAAAAPRAWPELITSLICARR